MNPTRDAGMTVDSSTHEAAVTETGRLVKRLSALQMLGLAFTILNAWGGVAGDLGLGLPEGGPVSFLYGLIFVCICTTCIAASLGEMASTWPSSGGPYHIAFHVSSPEWGPFNAWWCGWFNLVAWWIIPAAESIFASYYFMAMINVAYGVEIQVWQSYVCFLVIIIGCALANTFGNMLLGYFSTFAMIWNVVAFLLLSLITLGMTHGRYASSSFVFGSFINGTGWSDNGWVWFIGLLQSAILLVAYDSVMHMTEEMERPTIDVPRAMVYANLMGGVIAWIFLVIIFFCIQDIQSVINTPTGMPVTQIIWDATQSQSAAIGLTCLPFLTFVFGALQSLTSASRMTWAFARDGGMPNSKFWAQIHPTLHVPLNCIWLVTLLCVLYTLILFGSSTAFNALLSSFTVLVQTSYAYPMVVLVYRGRSKVLPVGDWHLGRYGTIVYIIGIAYCAFTFVVFMFPVNMPVTAQNMNYNVVVVSGLCVFGAVYWETVGRKSFKGPVLTTVEVLHGMTPHTKDSIGDVVPEGHLVDVNEKTTESVI